MNDVAGELKYFLGKIKKYRRYQIESDTYVMKGRYTNGGSIAITIRIKPKRKSKQGGK
jgi:hypothetical protein